MGDAEDARRQERVKRRLAAMGIEAHPMPGGRGYMAMLPLSREPFDTPEGRQRFAAVTFASVGDDRIKCLRPHPFFFLPLIRISDCATPGALETRLRAAWNARMELVRRTTDWLHKLGAQAAFDVDVPLASFPITSPVAAVRAFAPEPERVILPSHGPLGGVSLRRAEDRTLALSRDVHSVMDLELAVAARMEELARLDARLARERRRAALMAAPAVQAVARRRRPRVLVAGEQIAVERALLDAFRLRSFDVTCVRHGDEALHAFERRSFELVLADLAMDRGDGLALVPALRRVVGLEEIPVLVVDDRARPDLRDAARRVGAAGYLVRPIELARMEQHITQLIEAPRQRRFTRFHAAVPVRCLADGSSTVTCDIGRGGMQLRSEREVPAGTLERFEVVLAELGARLAVEAEVIHRRNEPGNDRRTLGLRFHHFADDGEAIWISFLASLAPTRRSRDPAR